MRMMGGKGREGIIKRASTRAADVGRLMWIRDYVCTGEERGSDNLDRGVLRVRMRGVDIGEPGCVRARCVLPGFLMRGFRVE